jgi:hypothetical protein
MANIVIDLAAEFTGNKAFKQADTATLNLTKNVKKLAGSLGIALGGRALFNYSKNAVKAFAADDKAAQVLTKSLNNLGLAFADPAVKTFIADLERQYGVLDDLLRPAYQKLLTTTGDYAKSQDLLRTALDLSAMSGQDVVTVSNDLAKAYAGNTRGLIKYGIGLSKTEIAAMSFEDILTQIAKVSSGQAQQAADSYAGSLDRLNVATANAAESIGKDLITALSTLGGSGGLPKTLGLIESFASGIGDAAIGISRLIRNIGILASGNPIESFRDLRRATAADRKADLAERTKSGVFYNSLLAAQAKSLATTKKTVVQAKILTKETAAQLKAKQLQNAIDKANLALAKGTDIFDMDKIQIAAALTNQAEQLGKATNASQVLAIANDVARLRVKQDILILEDAIAAGDQKAIEAATAKLNADLKILGTLGQQNVKLLDIKSILDSLMPKDLINLANLQSALDLLSKINLASTGSTKAPASTIVATKPNGNTSITPMVPSLTNTPFMPNGTFNLEDVARSSLLAGLAGGAGVAGAVRGANYAAQAANSYNITIQANTVANPDELTGLIQDTIIRLNKQGDYLTTAGAL